MNIETKNDQEISYYVDESGDFTLFDKKGIPVSAVKGVSKTVMLGALNIKTNNFPESFSSFKDGVLSNPIFQARPSFKKTQLQFHAADDHSAIRLEVFNYIASIGCSVQAVVRRKSALIEQAKTQFEYTSNKMTDKQLYGDLATRLFKQNIHKAARYNIYFSSRAKTFTNHSLDEALRSTKEKFIAANNITSTSDFKVFCVQPQNHPELQIIDYCLWALQRMYELKDDTFFNMIKDKFSFILDVDDKTGSLAGRHYWRKNPISLAKISEAS